MKLKKSIPMYIAILTLLTMMILFNITNLVNDFNIDSVNKYVYSAVKHSIVWTCIEQVVLLYLFHINILNFKSYLIKQRTKQKLNKTFDSLVDTLEDKIKDFLNDKSRSSKSHNNDIIGFDFTKSNEDFVKKETNKDLFDILNRSVKDITHKDLEPFTMTHYIVDILKNQKLDWIDLPRGLMEAILRLNHDNNNDNDTCFPLCEFIMRYNGGEFIGKNGKVKYNINKEELIH